MSISPFNPSFTLSIAEIKQARAFLYEPDRVHKREML